MASPIDHAVLRNKKAAAFFQGKTIERISAVTAHTATFYFTDGTKIALVVDQMGPGVYGITACEECAVPNRGRKHG